MTGGTPDPEERDDDPEVVGGDAQASERTPDHGDHDHESVEAGAADITPTAPDRVEMLDELLDELGIEVPDGDARGTGDTVAEHADDASPDGEPARPGVRLTFVPSPIDSGPPAAVPAERQDEPAGADREADAAAGDGDDAALPLNFRTNEERARSVYRLANPWYRRLARGVIAVTLVGLLAVGAFVVARTIQGWVDRDRLPSAGLDTPDIRETTFLLEAANPAITLDGTLTFDVRSGAFEFVGSPDGPNEDDWLTSPDGGTVYARVSDAQWRRLPADNALARTVREAMGVLSRSDDADAILTSRLRRGFVDLTDEVDEGSGPTRRTRYDIRLDLDRFADDFPLQWSNFANDIAPGITPSRDYPLSFWLDGENVLVRVDIPAAGWRWDRLAYSDRSFKPVRPPAELVVGPDVGPADLTTCRLADSDGAFSTSLDNCDQARLIGRQLAVSVGLADAGDDAAAEAVFVAACNASQGAAPTTALDDEDVRALAELLSDSGVCPGDPDLIRP